MSNENEIMEITRKIPISNFNCYHDEKEAFNFYKENEEKIQIKNSEINRLNNLKKIKKTKINKISFQEIFDPFLPKDLSIISYIKIKRNKLLFEYILLCKKCRRIRITSIGNFSFYYLRAYVTTFEEFLRKKLNKECNCGNEYRENHIYVKYMPTYKEKSQLHFFID